MKIYEFDIVELEREYFLKLFKDIFSNGGKILNSKSGILSITWKITDKTNKLRLIDKSQVFFKDVVDNLTLVNYENVSYFLEKIIDSEKNKIRWRSYMFDYFSNRYACSYALSSKIKKNVVYAKVDIKSFYPTLISRFFFSSYDVERKILSYPSRSLFIPFKWNKTLKVSLYGLMRSRKALLFNKNNTYFTAVKNKNFRPDLISLLYDVSNLLGSFAQNQCNSVYWNVDGGIIEYSKLDLFLEYAKSLNLDVKVEEISDDVEIKGIGCYRIGNLSTRNLNLIHTIKDNVKMYEVPDFLEKTFLSYSKI